MICIDSLTYLKSFKEEIELLLWNNSKEKYNRKYK